MTIVNQEGSSSEKLYPQNEYISPDNSMYKLRSCAGIYLSQKPDVHVLNAQLRGHVRTQL